MNTQKVTFLVGLQNPTQTKLWLQKHFDFGGLIFLGRSNVGKSTLINQLFLKDIARTSKTPGRTQMINVFEIEQTERILPSKTFLFDCPGMGFAQVPLKMREEWEALMLTFFQNIPPRFLCIHLMDSRHPFMKADLELLGFLKQMKINPIMVFTKTDKLKTQKGKNELNKLRISVAKDYKKVPQIHFISAESRIGTEELKLALMLRLEKIQHDQLGLNQLLA